jgi:hypothetical protein
VPHFSISIAVEEPLPGGKTGISHGLVYQPLTDETFWAERAGAPGSTSGACAYPRGATSTKRWSGPAFPISAAATSPAGRGFSAPSHPRFRYPPSRLGRA